MNSRVVAGFLAYASMLAGCSSIEPKPVLTRNGVSRPISEAVRRDALSHGPLYNFVQAEQLARPYVPTGSGQQAYRSEARGSQNLQMLETGFTAIYASCSDFFQSSGRDQTKLLVLRDLIVTLSSLAGGALAIIDGDGSDNSDRNENILAAIALGTTASLAGVDIYTERFLFGAENIDSVRELTLNALDAHRTKVLVAPPQSYERVVIHLLDSQAICTTRHIAMLARKAIAEGQVEAYRRPGGGDETVRRNDEAILDIIGQIVGTPRELSPNQAGALWWLLIGGAREEWELTEIAVKLARLPNSPFDASGKQKTNWASATNVRAHLRRLDPTTLAGFETAVAEARANRAEASQIASGPGLSQPQASAPELLPPVEFELGAGVDTGDSRVTVDVRDDKRPR